jgi:hypothetical protein
MIQDSFDESLPSNLGRSKYFKLDKFIEVVESLIRSDEILMAINMLGMTPAWHRDDPETQSKLLEIKKTLWERCYDSMEYASDFDEANYSREQAESQFFSSYAYPRGEILLETVNKYNKEGKTPWIFELSTSHGLLPLGLAKANAEFTFCAKNLNQAALVKVQEWLKDYWAEKPKDQPTIFVNTECLEHMYREEDLEQSYYKLGVDFDTIILSTPYGTLGGGLPDWKTRRLGHVRTFGKQEFCSLADKFFPGRIWELAFSHSMVLKGIKR